MPPYFAFLLGGMVGALGYGPIKRWLVTLRQQLEVQVERPDEQRKDTRKLLFIFATMHPAPWLLILGVPFGIYQLALGPLPWMWLWVFVGVSAGAALTFIVDRKLSGRRNARSRA